MTGQVSPAPGSGSLAVIIATRGRPGLVADLVLALEGQTRPPDHVFVVGSQPEDIAALAEGPRLTARVGRRGSALQRNDGLALAGERYAYLIFFDDDFVPARSWLERAVALFASHPDHACLTGAVLADGIQCGGLTPDAARAIIADHERAPETGTTVRDGFGPYGCNMAFRASAIRGLGFDERLPLYAWLEDSDFGGQVARRGRTAKADALFGVHLGHRTGRDQGLRIGYSQLANAAYLLRKGTLPVSFLLRTAAGNLARNLLRSIAPEPHVDRRGRLRGNLLALADLARGRVTPERVTRL